MYIAKFDQSNILLMAKLRNFVKLFDEGASDSYLVTMIWDTLFLRDPVIDDYASIRDAFPRSVHPALTQKRFGCLLCGWVDWQLVMEEQSFRTKMTPVIGRCSCS